MTSLAKQEVLITAVEGIARADWDRDPQGWLRASNRLFDAVVDVTSYAAASAMSDDELRDHAQILWAKYLRSGNA